MMTDEYEDMEMVLERTIREGEEARLNARREILSLRAELTALTGRLKQRSEEIPMFLYQREMKAVFDENELPTPYVIKIQAQLCQTLHQQEIQLKQMHLTKKKNKKVITYLQNEAKRLTEENAQRELELVNRIAQKNAERHAEMDALKEKVLHQEEEIRKLQRTLGMDDGCHSPVATRKSLSLRNLMESISPLATPKALRMSKVWADAKHLEQPSLQSPTGSYFKRDSSVRFSNSFWLMDSSSHSNQTNTSNGDRDRIPSRPSILQALALGPSLRNLMGTPEQEGRKRTSFSTESTKDPSDSSEDSPATFSKPRRLSQSHPVRGSYLGKDLRTLLQSHDDDAPPSPTTASLKKLSEEVFSY